jgi:hypothetical protein
MSLSTMLLFAFLLQIDLTTLADTDAAKMVFDAITQKNYWLVAGLVVWLLVSLTRKYGAKVPFLGPKLATFLTMKWSGPLLAVLASTAGGLVNLVLMGQSPSLAWFFSIIGSAATAVFTQEVQQKAREAAAQIKTAADADKFFKGP